LAALLLLCLSFAGPVHMITIDSKSNFQQANDLIPEQIAQFEAIKSRAEEIEVY
jgi:hypothetical protein